jgi:hypothetical protein
MLVFFILLSNGIWSAEQLPSICSAKKGEGMPIGGILVIAILVLIAILEILLELNRK